MLTIIRTCTCKHRPTPQDSFWAHRILNMRVDYLKKNAGMIFLSSILSRLIFKKSTYVINYILIDAYAIQTICYIFWHTFRQTVSATFMQLQLVAYCAITGIKNTPEKIRYIHLVSLSIHQKLVTIYWYSWLIFPGYSFCFMKLTIV